MHEITWHDQQLQLLPQRAVYWEAERTIWLADPHFGKDASFRRAGIPVPQASLHETLQRLTSVLAQTRAERLIVLGDFWHARSGRTATTLDALAQWRSQHQQLHCILVRGNHDQAAGDPPQEWRIECVAECEQTPFQLRHHPPSEDGRTKSAPSATPTVAGHVHPAYFLREMRVPCFYFGKTEAILPAFGSFTGTHCVRPTRGDRVYLLADGLVIPGPALD